MLATLLLFATGSAAASVGGTLDAGVATLQQWWQQLTAEPDPEQRRIQLREERFQTIWNQLIPKLEEGIEITELREDAPESALFSKDKEDYDREYQELIETIALLLDESDIMRYRGRIARLKQRIDETESEISHAQEARIGAPASSLIGRSRSDYDSEIADLMGAIERYREDILDTEQAFVESMARMGVELTLEQAQVLLARVDSNNILQMAVVFDSLKAVTWGLMQIMTASGQNIDFVRYYGMHVVLLDMALFMQDQYIYKINKVYLPKLEAIIDRTKVINRESMRQLRSESSPDRRRVYQSNTRAHQLTLNTARIYMEHLRKQRSQVIEVRNKIARDLALAKNTYQTVSVSSELFNVLEVSQSSFDVLIHMQVPEIVPFEDNQMLRKFEEISSLLGGE